MDTQGKQTPFTVNDYIQEYDLEFEEMTIEEWEKLNEQKEFGDIDSFSNLRKNKYGFIYANDGQVTHFELDEQLEVAGEKVFYESEIDDEDISYAYDSLINPGIKHGGYATFVKTVKIIDWEKLEMIEQAKEIVDKIGSWDQALAYAGVELLNLSQTQVGKLLEKDRSTIRRNLERAKKKLA